MVVVRGTRESECLSTIGHHNLSPVVLWLPAELRILRCQKFKSFSVAERLIMQTNEASMNEPNIYEPLSDSSVLPAAITEPLLHRPSCPGFIRDQLANRRMQAKLLPPQAYHRARFS